MSSGKRARRSLEDPPENETPLAAHQVVEHQDREAAERDADPEQIAHEVRVEELGGIRESGEAANGESGEAGHERRAAQLRGAHRWASSFARSEPGMSESGTFCDC